MDNYPHIKFTVLLLLISCETTFSSSIFGFNFGSIKNTAINNIEHVPKFLDRVRIFNRQKQYLDKNSPTQYPDNRGMIDNERVSFPYATNTLNPIKYEDQQNPTSFSDNQEKMDYNGYNTFSPSLNKYSQRQESDTNTPIAFSDNLGITDYNGYKNTFNPAPNKDLQGFSTPSSHFISKVTPGKNQNYAGSPVNIDSRGSFYDGGETSKPLLPDQYNAKTKNPADENVSEDTVTSDTDFNTDYTSTTSDYDWTTTDEPLNRIGAPPAIVASILG